MNSIRAFFDNLALEWDSCQPPDIDEIITRLLLPLDGRLECAGTILEVGTGTGRLIPILAQRYPGSSTISIDLSMEMLSRARQKSPHANLLQSDVHNLPIPNGCINAVICHNSFPHFQKKYETLLELRRILGQDGDLIVLHNLNRQQVNAIHQNADADIIHQDILPSGKELDHMLRQTGFHSTLVEDVETHYLVAGRVG
jgi:ubiquinone/menaquinone biosynthesis C-methylase UbiE